MGNRAGSEQRVQSLCISIQQSVETRWHQLIDHWSRVFTSVAERRPSSSEGATPATVTHTTTSITWPHRRLYSGMQTNITRGRDDHYSTKNSTKTTNKTRLQILAASPYRVSRWAVVKAISGTSDHRISTLTDAFGWQGMTSCSIVTIGQ